MGILGNLFGTELREANALIEKWENIMSRDYKNEWNQWLYKMDQVADEMKLNELQKAKLTCREAAKYAGYSLKNRIGLTQYNEDEVVNTKGNTARLIVAAKAFNCYQKYTRICSRFINVRKFDAKIERFGRGR